MMDGKEIELKLAVSPEALSRLKRLPVLRGLRDGPAVIQSLRSTYYDTPERHLAQAGITVRRRLGAGDGAVQTVKTAGNRTSGLFARSEWECAVTGDGLDHAHLSATGLAPLCDAAIRDALVPVFVTDIRRAAYPLRGDGWQVEMAVDTGELRAGERRQPICEVELELKAGEPQHLFTLARHVAEAVPVRLLATSKSDRGYELARGQGPQAVKTAATALPDDATVATAFQAIARSCLHHLLANQQALLEDGNGEAVHQMRVALRRLRSATKIFRPLVTGPELARLSGEIRWLLGLLGPARDAEVFMTEIIDPVVACHPDHPGIAALRQHWQQEWQADVDAARAAAADRRFTLLLLDLGAWVEAGDWHAAEIGHRPLVPFARKVRHKLAHRLSRAGGKHLTRLSPPALHGVRIRGKQLRYAAEFFALLGGKSARRQLLVLQKLQDCLGELNDIAVAVPRLASCHHLGETAWAAGLVAGWHEARRPALLDQAEVLWRQWRKLAG